MKFTAYSRPKAFNERPHNDIVGKNDVLSNGKCLRMLQRLNCREIYLAFQKLSMIMAMLLLIGLHNSENSFTFFLFLSVLLGLFFSPTHTQPLTGAVSLCHSPFPNCMKDMSIKFDPGLIWVSSAGLFGSWCLLSLLLGLCKDWTQKFSNKDVSRLNCLVFQPLGKKKYTSYHWTIPGPEKIRYLNKIKIKRSNFLFEKQQLSFTKCHIFKLMGLSRS